MDLRPHSLILQFKSTNSLTLIITRSEFFDILFIYLFDIPSQINISLSLSPLPYPLLKYPNKNKTKKKKTAEIYIQSIKYVRRSFHIHTKTPKKNLILKQKQSKCTHPSDRPAMRCSLSIIWKKNYPISSRPSLYLVSSNPHVPPSL